MSSGGGQDVITTLGPGADFRHDYDYLAGYKDRSDRELERLLRFRRHTEGATRGAIEERVAEHFDSLRRRLFESPYYRRVLSSGGLSPRDLGRVSDLAAFPTLSRAILGEHWREIPVVDEESRDYCDAALVRSSGSTGAPIQIVRDGYDLVHMWTMVRYWAIVAEVDLPPAPVVVLLCDLPSGLEYQSRLPTLDGGMLYRISTRQRCPQKRLASADPDILFSDPSGLHWLLGQGDVPTPRMVLSSAQYLGPAMRDETTRRLGSPVINYYSSSETGPIAWECLGRPGHFHVLLPDVWVESLMGELVVTRLRPSLVPLLRYRMGDAGQVAFDECDCGYRGLTISGFSGRRACEFVGPDGDRVDAWKLARLFKHRALDGFRLTQVDRCEFCLELLSADGGTDGGHRDIDQELIAALKRLGWRDPKVTVEYPRELTVRGPKPQPFCRQFDG